MRTQSSQGSIFRDSGVAGTYEISAYRASNALAFSGDGEKMRNFCPASSRIAHRDDGAFLGRGLLPAFGGQTALGLRRERERFHRKGIQDDDGFVITTRPPKRGRSTAAKRPFATCGKLAATLDESRIETGSTQA